MFFQTFEGPTCFPLPTDIAGSYVSSGAVITVRNAPDLKVGDYLYNASLNEIKKILAFITDNILSIESAFSSDVVEYVNIKIASRDKVYNKASISNAGSGIGYLNEEEVAIGQTVDINEGEIYFTIDGTGTKMSVLAQP